MPVGSLTGDCIRRRLSRLFAPAIKLIWDLATSNLFARKLIKWMLALPSSGGAVIRIFRISLAIPTILSLLAPG